MKEPKLILVGAGPGDPDLISVKGMKALQSADVVLYDALAHPDLLKYAENAECFFVGKKVGVCQFKQEDIHELIVKYAHAKGTVVRLKGGDPYIFGRGHEELLYAEKYGVKVEVVPGISSCYSVPELQQIPLTRRGINESFWVVTGTTRNHELSEDIRMAVHSSATVVVLMGMRKLAQIVELYQEAGRGNTPIGIIQNGSWDSEKVGLGRMNTILEIVEDKQLSSPAIIVIGEVVTLHPEYQS
ncbi:MAG: uroporphyrinogen-III C-methyltransferase [Cytophagales bacterium]|nr:uroporphyrinogen-III C-methyltransferase [Cytophagales bacterium]